MKELYTVDKIKENFYLIYENYGEASALTIGLIIGEKKAALVDCGMGMFGDELLKVVNKLTDKPVINLLTHGHPDHIGGAVLFKDVYMNSRDESQINRLSKAARMRDVAMFSKDDAEVVSYADKHCLDCSKFKYKELRDGDIFNLGGVKLEAIQLPGHSQGSMAFYNAKDNYVMIGDAVSDSIPASSMPSLEAFQEMADGIRVFLEKVPEDAVFYHGHKGKEVSRELAVEEMNCALEIAQKKVEADEEIFLPMAPIKDQKRHVFKRVGISYNPAIVNVQ